MRSCPHSRPEGGGAAGVRLSVIWPRPDLVAELFDAGEDFFGNDVLPVDGFGVDVLREELPHAAEDEVELVHLGSGHFGIRKEQPVGDVAEERRLHERFGGRHAPITFAESARYC